MRTDELYLADIVEAADAIARFITGVSETEFTASDLIRSAVLQKLLIIGEAAARVSDSLRMRSPEIPWCDIVGFRNFAIHAYFAVKWSIVWTTATEDVPVLKIQISGLLPDEPTGASS